jgi:hypothetical protein
MKGIIILVACCSLVMSVKAQEQPFQTWLTYNHQARLNDKWGYTFDLNHRTLRTFPFNSFLSAARAGGVYQINNALRVTAGYAWFGTIVNGRSRDWLHENRLYQQIQQNKVRNGIQTVQRIRLEQRFRQQFQQSGSDEVNVAFTFRARYMFQIGGPLIKNPKTNRPALSWQAANEIFFHFGESLNGNYFDQNRTLAGVMINLGKVTDLAVLYQFIAQRQPVRETTVAIHSVRFTLFQNLDFRKAKKTQPVDIPAVD